MFDKQIICPMCKTKVGTFKGQICTFSCSKCKILIVLDRESGKTKIEKDKQENRVTESGRRFL